MVSSNKDRNKNSNIRSNFQNNFDLISINSDKVKGQITDIFSYAEKSSSRTNTKIQNQTIATVNVTIGKVKAEYDSLYYYLDKSHISYLDRMAKREVKTAKAISSIWNRGNTNMYDQIASQHSNYLNGVIEREKQTARQIMDIRSSSGNYNNNNPNNNPRPLGNNGNEGNPGNSGGSGNSSNNLLLNTVVDVVERMFNIFLNRFMTGMDKIVNTYEETYTNVSVMMNQNQRQYNDFQLQTMDKIKEQGLKNNIAISDVMKGLDRVVSMGISGQEAQNKALSDTITKTIAPFIDVTSDAYTDLQVRLGPEFTDTISGMGEGIRQQTGQQRVFSKSINEIIDLLGPVALNSETQYAMTAAGDMISLLESSGMSTSDATQLAYKITQGVSNPYEALTGGDMGMVMAMANAKDPSNPLSVYEAYTGSVATIAPENPTENIFGAGAISSIFNLASPYYDKEVYQNMNKAARERLSAGGTDFSLYSDITKQNLADDKYTTEKAQRETYAENMSLRLAITKQNHPDLFAVLESIEKGVWASFGIGGIRGILDIVKGKGTPNPLKNLSDVFTKGKGSNLLENSNNFLKSANSMKVSGLSRIGGAAAGLAVGVWGASEAYDSYKKYKDPTTTDQQKTVNENAGWGAATGGIVGAAGGIALMAGLASNPVGWGLIASGALVVGVSKLYKEMNKETRATKELSEELIKGKESIIQEQEARLNQIDALKEQIDSMESVEDRRKALVDSGYATQEEAMKMTSREIDAFLEDMKRAQEEQNERVNKQTDEFMKAQKEEVEEKSKANADIIAEDLYSRTGGSIKEVKKILKDEYGLTDEELKNISYWTKGGLSRDLAQTFSANDYNEIIDTGKGPAGLQDIKNNKYTIEDFDYVNRLIDTLNTYKGRYDISSVQKNEYNNAKAVVKDILNDKDNKYYELLTSSKYGNFTSLRGYAGGEDYFPSDGLGIFHKGERILTSRQNKEFTKIIGSLPMMSTALNKLFDKRESSIGEESLGSSESVVSAIKESTNRIVEAISSINISSNNIEENSNNRLLKRKGVNNEYSENTIRLSPSLNTRY